MTELVSEIALSLQITDSIETLIHFKRQYDLVSTKTETFEKIEVQGPCLVFAEKARFKVNGKVIDRMYVSFNEEVLTVESESKTLTALVIKFREKNHEQ